MSGSTLRPQDVQNENNKNKLVLFNTTPTKCAAMERLGQHSLLRAYFFHINLNALLSRAVCPVVGITYGMKEVRSTRRMLWRGVLNNTSFFLLVFVFVVSRLR